jgi:steroid 5-alpha reductase family enzyme
MVLSKRSSLTIVCLIYVLAFAAGALLLRYLPSARRPLLSTLLADTAATLVVFVFYLIFRNASVYDPYWSVQPPFLALAFYVFCGVPFNPAQLIILAPLCLWAVRLTANWGIGFADLTWQDWRYVDLTRNRPHAAPFIIFFGIMYMPTCLVFLGSVPLYRMAAAWQGTTANLVCAIIGGVIILAGTALEFFSDRAMADWKGLQASRVLAGQPRELYIYRGLWKYLRHPNYLGEMLIWLGVFTGAIPALPGQSAGSLVLSCIGLVLMILLFCFISIPMMEKHMTDKSPESAAAYAEYRKKTPCWL